jgi:hypothetical protein
VGNGFREHVSSAFAALNSYSERAAEVEVTYYHEDGTDEYQLVFVGPTPEAIHEAQRQAMIDDVSAVLSRQFGDAEIGEVVQLINQLFLRASPSAAGRPAGPGTAQVPMSPQHRKRLH